MSKCAFWTAPEVEEVAELVINRSHDHLAEADIRYAFRSEPKKTHGKVALATVQRVQGLQAYLADGECLVDRTNTLTGEKILDEDTGVVEQVPVANEPFFLVLVWAHAWKQLDQPRRNALIDHELCHIQEDADGNLALIGHDIEEFNKVVERHGSWSPDIAAIVRAYEEHQIGQGSLVDAA